MSEFDKLVQEKLLSHEFKPIIIKKTHKKVNKNSAENSRRYYHSHKGEPIFEKMQKDKRKRKYDAMKSDPIRWERYLQQCRESKARKRSAA